jgi:signal transduction histidine kinase
MDPSHSEYARILTLGLHKIKSPLTVIRESIALVEDATLGQINDEQKIILGTALKNVDRLTHMLNDINDYEMLLLSPDIPTSGDYSLRSLLHECMTELRVLFTCWNNTFEIDLPDEDLYVFVNKESFLMALKKIIINAIQFAPASSILIRARNGTGTATISVHDSGVGIPRGYLREIVKPFTRFAATDIILEGGAGLGLTIADLIIRRQGGTLRVASEPEKGTTFTIMVPQQKWT